MPPKVKGPTPEELAAEAAAAEAESVAATAAAVVERQLLEEMCAELCEEVVRRAVAAAREQELNQYQCAVAAEDALSQMNRVIAWATLAYRPSPLVDDYKLPGQPSAPTSPILAPPEGLWSPERMPGQAFMDRHSRFEVASAPPCVKPPPVSRGRLAACGTLDTLDPRGSRGGGPRGKSAGRSNTPGLGESGTWAEEKVEIRDLTDPAAGLQGGAGGKKGADLEREYFAQMERDKQAAAAKQAAEAARLEAAQAVKKEWAEAMREVEGKKWTVDASGAVIVVQAVDGDQLPPRSVPVKYATEKAPPPPPAGGKGAAAGASLGGDTAAEGGRGGHPAGSPTKFSGPGAAAFVESMDFQPPLSKTLLPEDGVELTYDGKRKAGREIKGVEGKMSVAEYTEMTGFGPPGDRTASMDSLDLSATAAASGGRDAGGKNSIGRRGERDKAATKFPLLDPYKGGRPRASAGQLANSQAAPGGVAAGGGLGPRATSSEATSGGVALLSPSEKSVSWFAAEEAAKAAELEKLQALQSSLGRGDAVSMAVPAQGRGRKPTVLPKPSRDVRNALLPAQTPTAFRAKLAPPSSVGFSTGHGAAVSPGGEKKALPQAKPVEVVVVPEESEEQGLRYQIANGTSRASTRG
jgi:hypothetical protein